MKYAVWILVALLVVLHQDYWQWKNAQLDFAFLPRAITYHIFISLAAAGVWLLVIKYAWPVGSDEDPVNGSWEDVES